LEAGVYTEQINALLANNDFDIEIIDTANMKIAHCMGCNQCWLKTPGVCAIKDDYETIVKKLVSADNVWLVSDTKFGFIDYRGKRILDRIMPMLNMYIIFRDGWMRHQLRYHSLNVGVIYKGDGDRQMLEEWCNRTAANLGGRSLGVIAIDDASGQTITATTATTATAEVATVDNSANPAIVATTSTATTSAANTSNATATASTATENAAPAPAPEKVEHVIIINGSPRVKKISNTDKIIQSFALGLEEAGTTHKLYSLSNRSEWDEAREAFMNNEHIIIALPLYVECVPGLMLEFLTTIPTERVRPAKISFILHGGFDEGHQLRLGEQFLKSLPAKLGCTYGGTLVKGGSFMLRMRDDEYIKKNTDKVLDAYIPMGKLFAENGNFMFPEAKEFTGPEQIPWAARQIIALVLKRIVKRKFDNFAKTWGCTRPLDDKVYGE
jgi:multimeric flavodoxin WrbA